MTYMRVKCEKIMDGPGPSEAIVSIATLDGSEEVIVDDSLFSDGFLSVGPPVSIVNGKFLLELPREAVSGRSRVWVAKSDVVKDEASMAA